MTSLAVHSVNVDFNFIVSSECQQQQRGHTERYKQEEGTKNARMIEH